ncbi:hypothetical protein RJ639_006223, partial [Escallonia herrerae]
MYRHTSKGAWTFSMQDHGWQVSDCTAEGLKSENGGFTAWEPQRAYSWMEVYTNFKDNRSNLVQTSWALLSLMKAGQ